MAENRSKLRRYIGPVNLMALRDGARQAATRRLDFFALHGGPDALHDGERDQCLTSAVPSRGPGDLVTQHIDLN